MLDKSITFIASCDFCSDSFDTDEEDFTMAVRAMQREGWKVFKENDEWHHKCTSCSEIAFEDLT